MVWRRLLPFVLTVSVVLHAVYVGLAAGRNQFNDLFIYRLGAAIGLRGESPYPAGVIDPGVIAQYPERPELVGNCAFLMPPQAVLLLAPLTAVPWPAAKGIWVALGAAAGAAGGVAVTTAFGRRPDRLPLPTLAVIPVVL